MEIRRDHKTFSGTIASGEWNQRREVPSDAKPPEGANSSRQRRPREGRLQARAIAQNPGGSFVFGRVPREIRSGRDQAERRPVGVDAKGWQRGLWSTVGCGGGGRRSLW